MTANWKLQTSLDMSGHYGGKMSKELDRMIELSGINESTLSPKDKQKIIDLALKYSEKQLGSGNWKTQTAQMFNKAASEQPEDLVWLLKDKKMPSSFMK